MSSGDEVNESRAQRYRMTNAVLAKKGLSLRTTKSQMKAQLKAKRRAEEKEKLKAAEEAAAADKNSDDKSDAEYVDHHMFRLFMSRFQRVRSAQNFANGKTW